MIRIGTIRSETMTLPDLKSEMQETFSLVQFQRGNFSRIHDRQLSDPCTYICCDRLQAAALWLVHTAKSFVLKWFSLHQFNKSTDNNIQLEKQTTVALF